MSDYEFDLAVLGGGPGGYVAAIRAAQLGMQVACIDENAQLGGTCLRVGCIPSKALLESSEKYVETQLELGTHGIQVGDVTLDLKTMQQRRESIVDALSDGVASLLKHNGVSIFNGRGHLTAADMLQVVTTEGTRSIRASRVLIATGSRPMTIPGIELEGDRVGTSTEALAYSEVPGHLVVIGGGYIGLELGSVWRRLGADVTVVEALNRILPGLDSDMASLAHRVFQKQGLTFRLGARVQGVEVQSERCKVTLDDQEPLECDRVLLAVGRVANTEEIGLQELGIEVDGRGEISVSSSFETSVGGVFAIGDCIRGPKLAHKASHEAIACIEGMARGNGHVNYDAIPSVVYTHPEIASVGKTEDELRESGCEYTKGVFPLAASGRARTLGQTEGRVKILADKESDRVLGVHIFAARAGDLIAEAVAAMEFGASAEDLARVCHAHPTLSESLAEAALASAGQAIHMPNR